MESQKEAEKIVIDWKDHLFGDKFLQKAMLYEKAAKQFDLLKDPQSVSCYILAAENYDKGGNNLKAVENYLMVYIISPGHNEFYLKQAACYSGHEVIFINVAKQEEEIAKIYKKTQDFNRSIKFYTIATEIYGYIGDYSNVSSCLFKIANILAYQGQYNKAKIRYNAVVSLSSNIEEKNKSIFRSILCDFATGNFNINGLHDQFLNLLSKVCIKSNTIKFVDICKNFDSKHSLRPIENSILVQIKSLLEERNKELL